MHVTPNSGVGGVLVYVMIATKRITYMIDKHPVCVGQVHLYQLDLKYQPLLAIKNQALTLIWHLQQLYMVMVVRVETTTIILLQVMALTLPHYALMTGNCKRIIAFLSLNVKSIVMFL